jgi:hypothetical protein
MRCWIALGIEIIGRRREVDAPSRGVCWIFLASDVACDNMAPVSRGEVVYSPKDNIGLSIMTLSFPPSLNDALVVTKESEVLAMLTS